MQDGTEKNDTRQNSVLWHVAVCALIACVVFFVYKDVLTFEFISFDDSAFVYDNPDVKDGFSLDGITRSLSLRQDSGPYWHPLTIISHMADSEFYGLDAGKHHLTNLILHILNAILLYLFFLKSTGRPWESFFVAALFALHPVNVESVAWITQRKNVLAGFFWILSMNVFAFYIRKRHMGLLLLLVITFLCGYMSKPVMMTFPFSLLLLNYWPYNRYQPLWATNGKLPDGGLRAAVKNNCLIVAEVLPIFILMFTVFAFWAFFYADKSGLSSYEKIPVTLRILNAFVSDVVYIKQLFLPYDLSVFYPFPKMIPLWQSVGAVTFVLAATVTSLLTLKKLPWIAVGWFWYAGNLVVASGLMQRGYWPAHADRFVYLPFIGLFFALVWSVSFFREKFSVKNIIILIPGIIILAILAVQTSKQVKYWQNGVTLFSHAVRLNPEDSLSYTNLAFSLSEKGETDAAIENSYKALDINPQNIEAHNNLGVMLASKGRLKESLVHFKNALILYPEFVDAMINKGRALYKLGDMKESEATFKIVLADNPHSSRAHLGIGDIYFAGGHYEDAKLHYLDAIRNNGVGKHIYIRYGTALLASGNIFDATRYFRSFSEKIKDDKEALNKIGDLFKKYGQDYEAGKFYKMAGDVN